MDTESVRYDLAKFRALWTRGEPERYTVMTEEERTELAALPETFTVWRGLETRHKRAIEGLSWTLSRRIAEWFAIRIKSKGYLVEGCVRRNDVFALLNGRDEREIVAAKFSDKEIACRVVR
jgi:hypothetical protein